MDDFLCVRTDATFRSCFFLIIVILSVISVDPHLEDKQETFVQWTAGLQKMALCESEAAVKQWSPEVSGDDWEA